MRHEGHGAREPIAVDEIKVGNAVRRWSIDSALIGFEP